MKKQPGTGKKAESYDQENYFQQNIHKDKERRDRISQLYKEGILPKNKSNSLKKK